MITLFQIIIHHSHRCFHYHIYVSDKFSQHVSYHNTLEFYRVTSSQLPWMQQITAREYGIWNATIESLQFWAEDLDLITLGIASECVYTHFFWTSTSHTLCQLSDKVLFGHFVLALKSAFHQQCPLQMKVMKVVLMKTYQHLYGKLLAYTMCPYGACIFRPHLLYTTSTT